MPITAITIENFKGIKDPVRIELKPINLLFGANSAGKSTVIQALHYAREIFERNNCDPNKTIAGGDTIDLGGFKNLVHGQLKKGKEIKLSLEYNLSGEELPEYSKGYENLKDDVVPDYDPDDEEEHERLRIFEKFVEQERINDYKTFPDKVSTATVTLTIRWNVLDGKAYVAVYEVDINESPFATIKASSDCRQITLTHLNICHPIFGGSWESTQSYLDDIRNSFANENEDYINNEIYSTLDSDDEGLSHKILFLLEIGYISSLVVTGTKPIGLYNHKSALPQWDLPISMHENVWTTSSSIDERGYFVKMLSSLIYGPGELIRNNLKSICYLGPLRKIPPRAFQPQRYLEKGRWADGLAAYDILFWGDDILVKKTNEWFSEEKRLNSGYNLEIKKFKELGNDHPVMQAISQNDESVTLATLKELFFDENSELRQNILKIPSKRRLLFRDNKTDIELSLQDIGVGISQVLPVIVAALSAKSGIVVIEQPELHIHPAFQVVLGDLFIEQIRERPDVTFILETHSEHLLLRLLRRIRETSNGEAPADLKLKPSDLSINFIEQGKEGVVCTTIGVDEEGDFTDRWPRGFFAERSQELFG